MGTKTIHVCDICGAEATVTRTIDVCGTHRRGELTKAGRARPKRTNGVKAPCPFCGQMFDKRGLGAHMRTHQTPETAPPEPEGVQSG